MSTEIANMQNPIRNILSRAWKILRAVLAACGWGLLVLFTLLAGYIVAWMAYTRVRIGGVQAEETLPILGIAIAIAAVLAFVLARFFSRPRMVGLAVLGTLGLLVTGGGIWTLARPADALFWARQLGWGDSSIEDHEIFPQRPVANAAPAFIFPAGTRAVTFGPIEYRSDGEMQSAAFEEFLASTDTAAFLVIRDDALLYEGYFNGYRRDSLLTAFSVSKSITSALIGIAIDEGYIGSVNDRMTDYLPELRGRGFDDVTLRDLLMMSAGIRYVPDDEVSPLAEITQFTDSGLAYSHPGLRGLGLTVQPDGKAPGTEFNYNEYHPILLGMILERATGRSAAEYLEEKIWKPLGMEYGASWSLDSEEDGFELMGSGVNGRAIDFAKIGRLFLHNGIWEGKRILSEQWARESTAPISCDGRTWHVYQDWKDAGGYYSYLWWGMTRPDGGYDFAAQGHLGQWIFVSPRTDTVIVRFGTGEGGVDSWMEVFQELAERLAA